MTPAAVNYPTITSPVTPSIQNSDLTLAMTPAAVNHPTITSPVTITYISKFSSHPKDMFQVMERRLAAIEEKQVVMEKEMMRKRRRKSSCDDVSSLQIMLIII